MVHRFMYRFRINCLVLKIHFYPFNFIVFTSFSAIPVNFQVFSCMFFFTCAYSAIHWLLFIYFLDRSSLRPWRLRYHDCTGNFKVRAPTDQGVIWTTTSAFDCGQTLNGLDFEIIWDRFNAKATKYINKINQFASPNAMEPSWRESVVAFSIW